MSIEFGYRVDLLVEEVAVVEIKAVENILPVHEAQLLSYLKLTSVVVPPATARSASFIYKINP